MTYSGAGNAPNEALSWNGDRAVYGAVPASGADREVQFNGSGSLSASPGLTYSEPVLTERQLRIQSPDPTSGNARLVLRTSAGTNVGQLLLSDSTDLVSLTSTQGLLLTAAGADGLRLQGGALSADKWPTSNGTAGQVLTTNGAGTLSWSTPTQAQLVQTWPYSTASAAVGVKVGGGATYDLNAALLWLENTQQFSRVRIAWPAVAGGQCRVGIYTVTGALVVQSALTAVSATAGFQTISIPATVLTGEQFYYVALACDTAASTSIGRTALFAGGGAVPPNVRNTGLNVVASMPAAITLTGATQSVWMLILP